MAFSMKSTVAAIRAAISEVTAIQAVYSAAENDEHKVPDAINEFPSVVVIPGPEAGPYIMGQGGHRRTYDVRVLVFCRAGSDTGESIYQGIDIVDLVIAKFADNVTLGGLVNVCKFERQSGYVVLEWGGQEVEGIEITLRVSEQAVVHPQTGS